MTDRPEYLGADNFVCTGGWLCKAIVHIHGCYMDVPPAYCDQPDEHRPKWASDD